MAQRYRRLAIGPLVALAVVSASCAGEEPEEAERLTACRLLPAAVVERIIDGDVDEPATAEAATDGLAGRSGCAWTRSDDERAVLVELVRTADMSAPVRRTGFSASARYGAARARFPDAEELDLGDRSMFVEEEASLHVLVAGSYLTVEVAAQPPSAVRRLAEELGRQAVARLREAGRAD